MKAMIPAVVERLYDWLPLGGEDKVTVNYIDGDVTLHVEYHDARKILSRKITFEHASHFFKGPIQGGDFLAFEFSGQKSDIDCVVEYKNSEFASTYTKTFANDIGTKLFTWKHYFVSFTSANMVFHIIATDVSVSEEQVALDID